jgi:hypothetical protein
MPTAKPSLASYELPESKRRRGSFVVRMALQRIALRQRPEALKAAARMVLLLPIIQVTLLVGILNAETWMLLLGLEGLLIAWLASSQLARPNPESKLIGFGIALLNIVLLAAAGLFLNSHVFWVTGVIALLPLIWLVFGATRKHTVKLAWLAWGLPLGLLLVLSGAARGALVMSEKEEDPGTRGQQLQLAWYAMNLRGGNGSERALLRLRQAQAAFEAGDYERAYAMADDGLFDGKRLLRAIPASMIGGDLIDSLIRVKAQAFYNHKWDKQGNIYTPIKGEPLDDEARNDKSVGIRWGW